MSQPSKNQRVAQTAGQGTTTTKAFYVFSPFAGHATMKLPIAVYDTEHAAQEHADSIGGYIFAWQQQVPTPRR